MRGLTVAVLLSCGVVLPAVAADGLGPLGIDVEILAADQTENLPTPDFPLAPADALPDGRPALGNKDIAQAWLTVPTDRYGHAVLGDAVEAGGLLVVLPDDRRLALELEADSVFEDLMPRLADLDGDGTEEVIVVRAYLNAGAALAVYGVSDGALRHVAETPAIGTPNRWLNPVGAADLDGDGEIEVAYVETPHIGGILRIVSLQNGRLVEEGQLSGFSNHAIGSRALGLSALLDVNGDGATDLLLPDAARRTLRIISFAGGDFEELARLPHDARIESDFRLVERDGHSRPAVLYHLEDGRPVLLKR